MAHLFIGFMEDDQLLAGIRRDDAVACEAFVSKYAPRIRLALRMFRIPENDSDDVLQEVLATAIRQIRSGLFEGRSQLFSWIHHMVRGKAVDHRRTVARRLREVSLPDRVDDLGLSIAVLPEQEASVTASEALEGMPPRVQLLLRLHYRQNVPVGTIAQEFGLSEKRVRTLLTEAKARFRDAILRPHGENLPKTKRLTQEGHVSSHRTLPRTVTE
jgi:RNA polymerase sigma factor (sigma-70 family)